LLQGEKTVDDTTSNVNDDLNHDQPVSLTDDDEEDKEEKVQKARAVSHEYKYPFQMPLPPAGTNAYEQDLLFLVVTSKDLLCLILYINWSG
jgi:hypothetical protein